MTIGFQEDREITQASRAHLLYRSKEILLGYTYTTMDIYYNSHRVWQRILIIWMCWKVSCGGSVHAYWCLMRGHDGGYVPLGIRLEGLHILEELWPGCHLNTLD